MLFLKKFFRICGFLGIFPLDCNSLMRSAHLIFIVIFNIIGIMFACYEFKESTKLLKIELLETVILALTYSQFILLNIICMYGIFKNKKSWKQFFDILDKLNTGILTKPKSKHDTIKFMFILLLIFIIQFTQIIWYIINRGLTFSNLMTAFFWISTFLESFSVTVVIWKLSNIFTSHYYLLGNLIKASFSENCFKTATSTELLKIQINLFLLHRAVLLINNIMGKMICVLLTATFIILINFFNFVLFFLKTNNEFSGNSIIDVLLCLELIVSTSYFYFLIKH